jgi:catechol-2,3-dioxygenase
MAGDKFDVPAEKVFSPAYFAHVVLRTTISNVGPMIDFYKKFLGGTVSYEDKYLCFITYDETHHRIAIAGVPETVPKNKQSCGLDHIAFTFESLEDLLLAYRQRKQQGIVPWWCVNHGTTTSMYYKDPDGNKVETQVENFDTVEEAKEFMTSEEFQLNPIGTDYDPEDLIARLRSGEDEKSLKKRVEAGPRHVKEDMY